MTQTSLSLSSLEVTKLIVILLISLVTQINCGGKGKGGGSVPIYMPIPIPVPMPVGPHHGGGGKPSYGGGGGGGSGGGGGGGEVRKIYVLQAIPQQHTNRGMKGGGVMHPHVHPNPVMVQAQPQPPASYEPPVVRHRAPTHQAKKVPGGYSHGDEGGLSEYGSKTQKNLIDSQLKILPIIVIPPIAPMGPIQLPQVQTKYHSGHSAAAPVPKMTLTPQFNNYVLAPKSSPSNSNQFVDDFVPPNIAPFTDAKSFADYGGSTGGTHFKQTIGARSRRRSHIVPPSQDMSNDGYNQRPQRTNNRPTGDYDSIQSQIDEPPISKASNYGPRQFLSPKQISVRRTRQQQQQRQFARGSATKSRRITRPQLGAKSEEFDEPSQQHQDFFDDDIEQDLDGYRQSRSGARGAQYNSDQAQFEQSSNGAFNQQQQQENVASYTEPRQQVAQLEPPIFNDYDDIRPNRLQSSDDNAYSATHHARQQQSTNSARYMGNQFSGINFDIQDNSDVALSSASMRNNARNQRYQQHWTRTRQPSPFYDDTSDSYDSGASVIDELRGLASVKSMSFANFTTATSNSTTNDTLTNSTISANHDHNTKLTSIILMPIKQLTQLNLNHNNRSSTFPNVKHTKSNDAAKKTKYSNVNSRQHHTERGSLKI